MNTMFMQSILLSVIFYKLPPLCFNVCLLKDETCFDSSHIGALSYNPILVLPQKCLTRVSKVAVMNITSYQISVYS